MKKGPIAAGDADGLRRRIAELEAELELERTAREDLADRIDRHDQLVSLLPDAVIVHRKGKIVYANPVAVALHGAEAAEQIIGRDPLEFVHPDDRHLILQRRQNISTGPLLESLEHRRRRIDGSGFMAKTRSSEISWHGKKATLVVVRDSTRRERVRMALRDSEGRYRDLIEGSTFGIQISRSDGTRLFVNPKLVEMFGYDRAEDLLAITEPGVQVAPHDRERLIASRQARARGEDAPEVYEYDALRKDGSIMPVQVFVRHLIWEGEAAIQRTFIDITARWKAEQAQRESEERYRFLVEFVPEAVLVTYHGKIVFCNRAAIQLFGATDKEQLIGIDHVEFIHPEDRPLVLPRMQENVAHVPVTSMLELRRFRLDGTEFTSESCSAPFMWEGQATRLVIIRDISERKKVEEEREGMLRHLLGAQRRIEEQTDELKELAEKSDQARREAQSANQAKSEFLALMSHELRTPLNAVLGFSEIISNQTFGPLGTEKYGEYAKDIYDSGQHLLDLINDILDLSKVESGNEELNEEDISVHELLFQLMRLLTGRAERGNVTLKYDCAEDLHLLRADRRKLKQIFVNLLSNAIKFTPEGSGVELRVWCHPESGHVFQIVDTGIGIALEDIPKALAPFRQVESELTRTVEGTGLGLPLSKALVELHSGSLDVQSEVGVGTTVTVRFPAERVVARRADNARAGLKSA